MSSFHLYILGRFVPGSELATLAEFQGNRAVERVTVTARNIASLTKKVTKLRVFIEAGAPPFDNSNLESLGAKLFDFVLTGSVRRLLDTARGGRDGGLLPLELFLEDDALAGWPWEYMFDDDAHSFLSQEFHPISRGIFTIVPRRKPRPVEGNIKLALLFGVRRGDATATPEEEEHWIRNIFEQGLRKDSVDIDVLQGATYRELEKFLAAKQFHILHFFGHAHFETKSQSGYLRFDSADKTSFQVSARNFAMTVTQNQNDTRLVFLNACESGRASAETDPARSSIAAALVELGIPAVIATQFSIPDVSAHFLSSQIYEALASGQPLIEAMTSGRRAILQARDSQAFDWGIPVLYASDPSIEVFPAYPSGSTQAPAVPSKRNVNVKAAKSKGKLLRVALVDLDAKAGFLPELVEQANRAQSYYDFKVSYLPLPAGAILTKHSRGVRTPVLMMARLDQSLKDAPAALQVDRVACVTACLIGGVEKKKMYYDLFAMATDSNKDVFAVSVDGMREYAAEAKMAFSKAVLFLVLAELVRSDKRWTINYHDETLGCLFDFCYNRHDVVEGLLKSRLDHKKCRNKITDTRMLQAVDALLAL